VKPGRSVRGGGTGAWLTALAVTLWVASCPAGEFDLGPLPGPPPGHAEPTPAQLERMRASDESLRWHREAKLGISIHWGPVALTGAPMSWGRLGPRPGAGRPATSGIPMAEYDRLFERFDPVEFDADAWVGLFRRAGARYFYFTAKHHDGFCMFDTATTEYDIMSTPFGRDVAAELAAAAQRQGLRILWYYSQPDWVHPNALQEGHYEYYLPYMQTQVDELLGRYGRIDGLWFDHLASRYYHWNSVEWLPALRAKHPGLLFNNRIGHGLPPEFQGDWFVYELRVGPWHEPRQWESNITLTRAWAWHGGDLVKPFDTVLRLFLQVVGNGGNLLLNLGPTPEGAIAPRERAVLERLGIWMERYGDAVYGTQKGLYKPGPWGGSARRGDELFLFALEQHSGDRYEFTLPALARRPSTVEALTPGRLEADFQPDRWRFLLDGKRGAEPAVIRMVFDGGLDGQPAVETDPEDRKLAISRMTASTERSENNSAAVLLRQSAEGVFGEGIHIRNWWSPAPGDSSPWLELELESPAAVRSLVIGESIRTHAVRRFRVSYEVADGGWVSAFSGDSIGEMLSIRLDTPETARLRIDFLAFEDSPPNITAIEAFAP